MRADFTPSSGSSMQPQHTEGRPGFTESVPTRQQELLLIEPEAMAVEHAAVLRRDYRVFTTTDSTVALEYLSRSAIALVILDGDSHGPAGTEICVTARALHSPATVLMTVSKTVVVPEMITAGCDAFLMKPFAANLLYARIGRLMRMRGDHGPNRSHNGNGNGASASSAAAEHASTNRTWPGTACPACALQGAVSFEFSSYRRSWYACLACNHVWIGKRQE